MTVHWKENLLPALGVGVMLVAVVSIGIVIGLNSLVPPRMEWDAVQVTNKPSPNEMLVVKAHQIRRDTEGCTNGFQTDMRNSSDHVETRLPVPTRALSPNGDVRYDIVLPPDAVPGRYEIRVRETFRDCGRDGHPIETPWLPFEIVAGVG